MAYYTRNELIKKIKELGFNYKWEKYSNEALFNIWKKAEAKVEADKIARELETLLALETDKPKCLNCNSRLTDAGDCPVCDFGDNTVFDK